MANGVMPPQTNPPLESTKSRRAGVWDFSVKELIDRFAEAVVARDADAVLKMCELPLAIVADSGVRTVLAPEDVDAIFVHPRRRFGLREVRDTHAEIVRVEWLTERIARVDVRWPKRDPAGVEIGAEDASYTLRRDDSGDLKLCVALLRGDATTQ
jgi:hypothetical protein